MTKPTKKDMLYWVIIAALIVALTVVSVLFGISRKNGKEADTYYNTKCASFEVQNANLSKGQIVFIGDSITDLFPLDSYFHDLPLATYNRGISGDMTGGVLNRLKVSLYDLKPAKIVLLIGVNDVDFGIEERVILDNYAAILKGIKENLPSTEVYCLSILPQHDTIETYAKLNLERNMQHILALNPEIKALAEKSGYTFVDLYSAVSDGQDRLRKELSDDGLHLNAAGFAVWASVIKPYLQ